jgi:hypothetical protein
MTIRSSMKVNPLLSLSFSSIFPLLPHPGGVPMDTN